MAHPGSVTRLLLLLHSADPAARNAAAAELVARYTPELLGLIAARMTGRLQQRVAPEDVLQDVLLSFCARQRRGEFDLVSRDQFLGLVVTMALRKVASAARREHRQRRDVRRDQPLVAGDVREDGPGPHDPADPRAVPPDVAAEVADEVGRLLADLPAECREVALLRLEGDAVEAIARKVDRTPRTVERRLNLIRELWRGGGTDPGAG